ncbi:superoxide dismutase family protein [Bartonella sp. WD16.2]|uniref:superoxide dismutase family protein n=1 Tax=Bartonella sp. WD16.2 TaxID=1933904 RepID=UPI00099ABC31|nr:superoxide dismutase family protein [Bartonella sp. WD16.2]AQX19835.1 superoxide dismutase, Cu-Zn family [Bartonella sp. WD16.2]
MNKVFPLLTLLMVLYSSVFALAESTQVTIYRLEENNVKKSIGKITVQENKYGLIFIPDLSSLPEGFHGFHVHMYPSCDTKDGVIGGSAGGHYDPKNTNKHLGPYNINGHLGDLPMLYVDAQGRATMSVLAPRIKKLTEIRNRSLMIHIGEDTFSSEGGGGARLACGVIK